MKKQLLSFALAFASFACFGQAFTPGNLLVVRSGDLGAAPTAGTYSTIYLDEYNSAGTLVTSHAISGLVGEGASTNEGYYQLSPNGMYLAVGGYAKNVGDTRTINVAGTGDLAKIQIYGSAGTVLKSYTMPAGVFSTGDSETPGQVTNSRFTGTVALNDGTGVYAGGGSTNTSYGGVFYVNNNVSTGNIDVFNQVQTTQSNLRVPGIFAGQLFASGNAAALGNAAAIRLGAFNTALPTTAGGSTVSNLPGADFSVTTGANGGVPINICQYVVFDADATIPGYDVLLVTDDGTTVGRKGVVKKYVKNGSGNWILKYEVFTGSSNADVNNYKFRGLVSSVNSGNNVSFYATAYDPVNLIYKVVKFTDANIFTSTAAPSWSTLITAPSSNYVFKGISLTPGTTNLVLPLRLTSFTGSLKLKTADLNWKTNSEVNTSHFDVERSLDGQNFETVGTVTAKNTNGVNNYNFTDKVDFSGVAYYRLKMVDLDGSVAISDLVVVKNNEVQELSIYPNPVANILNVSFEKAQISGTISVIKTNGEVILTQKISVGSSASSIDISSFASGMYILKIDNNSKNASKNFVKK